MNQNPKNDCHECKQRLKAGPHYDRLRGSGRTQRALSLCIMGAMGGKRVLYVMPTTRGAEDLRHHVTEYLIHAGLEPATSVTMATASRVYFHGGGWLDLRGMHEDLSYRGLKDCMRPQIITEDHHVKELRLAKEKRDKEASDLEVINRLLAVYGQRAQLVIREGKHIYQLRS